MSILTIKEIIEDDEGYIYTIIKKDLIPFEKEIINSLDSDYLADAKFIVNTVEDVHPYFLTEFYDFEEYKKIRTNFLDKCKNTSLVDFKFQILKYFKVLCDGHMSVMPSGNYELNIDFEYINNTLYLKDTEAIILKIGGIEIEKIIEKIDEYFYFENLSNRELYISEYLKEKLFLEYIGCIIVDNNIEILTNVKLEQCRFTNKAIKYLISDIDENFSNYTIKCDIIDDIFYIDYKECRINNELNSAVNSIKNALNIGVNKFIIDVRNNLGGTAKANEKLLTALNIIKPESGSIVRLSNNIKIEFAHDYKFNDLNEEEISYTFYRPNLQSAKMNDDIKLVVLTSKYTYSASMLLALEISDGDLGLVIGEIPSNSPCSFGDIYFSETPRLKLPFRVSYKYIMRLDFEKGTENLLPDIKIESKKALNKAISYLKGFDTKVIEN